LIEDLERGKSLERRLEKAPQFVWNETDPAMLFAPVVRLAPHEQALADELSRMSTTVHAWGTDKRLRALLSQADSSTLAQRLSEDFSLQSQTVATSQSAMPSEEADRWRTAAQKQVAEFIEPLVTAHVAAITRQSSLSVVPLARSSPPLLYRVQWKSDAEKFILLVYSIFGHLPSDLQQREQQADRVAVVHVSADSHESPDESSGTDPLRDALAAIGSEEQYVIRVPLDEGLESQRQPLSWGSRALDEIYLALLWLDQPSVTSSPAQLESQLSQDYALLTSHDGPRLMSLRDAVDVWLDGGDPTLIRVSSLPPTEAALCIALRQTGRVVLSFKDSDIDDEDIWGSGSLSRLLRSGRLVVSSNYQPWRSETAPELALSSAAGRNLLSIDLDDDEFRPYPIQLHDAVIHPMVAGVHLVRLAKILLRRYYDHAVSLLNTAAESGDLQAVTELSVFLAQQNRQASRRWQARLRRLGSSTDMIDAGDRLQEVDPEGAIDLFRAAVGAGSTAAMTRLAVAVATRDREESRHWQSELIKSGSSNEMNIAGDRLREVDPTGAITLYRAAAGEGNTAAMISLVVHLATTEKEESRHWQSELVKTGSSNDLNLAGDGLHEIDPTGAIALYRAAANAGSISAMKSLAVDLATSDKEESRHWQSELIKSGAASEMDLAGDRLKELDPDGAIALYRAAADAGNSFAKRSLKAMLQRAAKEANPGSSEE
jgi:TPR repeat protein